jgi:MFS family permease
MLSLLKRQKKPFKVNMVRAAFQQFFISLTQQYESLYIVSLGADPLQLGLINSIGGIASASISMPTGLFADKYGIRKIFLFGLPLLAFGSLIFFLALDWLMIIPALLISLLSLQIVMTVCPMVCGRYLEMNERATGMQFCDTLSAVLGMISPIIAAMIITEFGGLTSEGIRPLYGLRSLGIFLLFLFVLKFYRDINGRKKTLTSQDKQDFYKNMKTILFKTKNVKPFIFYRTVGNLSWIMSLTYLPLFLAEIKGADQFIIGGMATISRMVPLFLSIPLGRLADSMGRKKAIFIVTPLYALSVLLLIYAPNPTILLVSAFFQGFFMLGGVTQAAMTQELIPTELLGTWWGILNLLSGTMRVVGPILAGFLWSFFGPVYVFLLIFILEISKLIFLWLFIPETLKRN